MPTIKDALSIINKLTDVEREKLKSMLLNPTFSKKNDIKLIQLKAGKTKSGIYNIQHVNNYHSRLKKFMYGFNGVSTKYLNNYLVWNNFVNYSVETFEEKINIFLSFVLSTLIKDVCRKIPCRPAIPLIV